MFAANTMSQSTTQPTFVDLATLQGSGESSRFTDNVTGVLLGIEMRAGTYEVTDRRTGQKVQRPNSWTSYWMVTESDGSQHQMMMSWPTYEDKKTGQVMPWSRYSRDIDLNVCAQQGIALHFWKDNRNFYHLEVVEQQQVQTQMNNMPIMGQQQPQVQQPAGIPWRQN